MDRGSNITRTIQFMMSKGCVSSDEFVSFLQELRQEHQSQFTDEKVLEALSNTNAKLKPYNMMIRYTLDDKTNVRYYSLINTVDNEVTRKAILYSNKEFEFFKLIFEKLQDWPSPLEEIYELTDDLTSKRKEELVEEWISKYWLRKESDHIRLGPRAKAELDVLMVSSAGVSQPRPSTSRSTRANRSSLRSQTLAICNDSDNET